MISTNKNSTPTQFLVIKPDFTVQLRTRGDSSGFTMPVTSDQIPYLSELSKFLQKSLDEHSRSILADAAVEKRTAVKAALKSSSLNKRKFDSDVSNKIGSLPSTVGKGWHVCNN
jgi:hypothetical protein